MSEMSNSNFSKTTSIQQAIASCCGAIITSLFVTPLDVVKTRLQAQSNPFPKGKCFVYSSGLMDHMCVCESGNSKGWYKKNGHFKGTLDAFVKIIKVEGIKSLWSGFPPTLSGNLTVTTPLTALADHRIEHDHQRMLDFDTLTDICCPRLLLMTCKKQHCCFHRHSSLLTFLSFSVGSVTVVSPLELIRTRMQYRKLSYKQLHMCISSKVARDGWLSLWRGWSSTVLRDVPFSAMYWYNYERFKKMMCKNLGAHKPTFFIAFTSGAASGSIAAVITLPFDVVKTHRQTELWESETLKIPQSASTWAVMRKIVAKNGIAGLFAGIGPRLFKVAPACAIMISTYEYGKSFFSHLNEKSNQHP
eukprot:XP_027308742.1 solute carrier family 25 member 40 [Anas platyrhynchos]